MTEFKEYDMVRVVRLLSANRHYHGTVGVRRPPKVGDVATIVHVYDREDPRAPVVVEKVDADGHTIWSADFERHELELVDTSA